MESLLTPLPIEKFAEFIKNKPDLTIEPNNVEGVRVNTKGLYGSGWFLLRMSLHEPLLVLTFESDNTGKIKHIRQDLKIFFNEQIRL